MYIAAHFLQAPDSLRMRYAGAERLYDACTKHLAGVWPTLYQHSESEFRALVDVQLMNSILDYTANHDLRFQMGFMSAAS